jgi:hypothetical protein
VQYNKRTKSDITENFLINLMLDRGVLPINPSDVEKFTKPTKNNEYNPELLDNM